MSILEKFTVVDLIKTRSESVVTIQGNSLKFNRQTAAELHFASHIQVLINQKGKQFAIRACKEDAPNAIPFSKPEGEQKYKISITVAAVTDMIRKMAEWPADAHWNIPGAYFAEDEALVYDIRAAVKPAPPKGGWAARKVKEDEAPVTEEEADN